MADTRPSPTSGQDLTGAAPDEAPAQWHRVLTLLADISLFIGTRAVWTQAASHHLVLAAVVSLCYASILTTGVLALVVRRRRTLARLDGCVLVTAMTLALCAYAMNHGGSDEAVLTTRAAHEFLAGHQVYGRPWPWLFGHGVALTPTMTGGYDYTYGYPPLPLMLTAPLLWIGHGAAAATLVSTLALIVGAIVMWRLLPVPWRSAATLVCLGFGLLPVYGRLGYPAIVALALLVPVVVGWPRMGGGGRGDWVRAACLGAACAAQQLPWFLAPFLLAGIYALLAAAVTAPPQSFATAWQPRPAFLRGPHRRGARMATALLLLTPSLAAVTLAATGSPPLRMQVLGARRTTGALAGLTVRAANLGDSALRPHFTLTTGQGMGRYWFIASGPTTIPAHSSARYELLPPSGRFALPRAGVRIRIRAFSASPMTLSSADVHLPAVEKS
ncbi:hypothetical protein OG569_06875 [Streptomyces sp. NBC_00827]|nr:hypothetical protein OG569_06875 [Streptomyces sp. NBC_00827]